MTDHIHKIPYTSVVRERERTIGGNAEPNSPEAIAICHAVRDRLATTKKANRANFGSDLPRLSPDGEVVAFEKVEETRP